MDQSLVSQEQTMGKPLAVKGIDAERFKLICAQVAKGATPDEVALFLEQASRFDLDPFAKEIWCIPSQGRDGGNRKLLIMVGRDGLRKIAQRNGLKIDGDVVREHDTFKISRNADRSRAIEHAYEEARAADADKREGRPPASTRGPIIGAWAEVWDGDGTQRGWFYAPMSEYRPKSEAKLQHSPWGTQESVMILAAAERQALRQATPLSGLLVEGEMDLVNERQEGVVEDAPPLVEVINTTIHNPRLATEAEQLMSTMCGLAPGSWTPSKIELVFRDKSDEEVMTELESISDQIEDLRAPEDADVVT